MGRNDPTVYTDPRIETWVRANAPLLGWGSTKLWQEFKAEFGRDVSYESFRGFCRRTRTGSHIPESPTRILTDYILKVKCKSALITSDWHIPYHDASWATFAFEIGKNFGCDVHIVNGDLIDAHLIAKFDPQLYKHGVPLGEEFELAEEVILKSCELFGSTKANLGNHEWRAYRSILRAQIGPERFQRLLSDEDRFELSEFSYIVVNETTRCTHPKNFSRIPTRVASDLAAKYHMNVVAAHGHLIGYRRDISGEYVVIDSGGMYDPRRLDYVTTVDNTIPQINQGFALLDGSYLYLFDARNCDREFWRWASRKRSTV